MSEKYLHGGYVTEYDEPEVTPLQNDSGLQVVVGTAPVHLLENPEEAVNVPILLESMADMVEKLGYSTDFSHYTLCEAAGASFTLAGVAPIVVINVLDPAKHVTEFSSEKAAVNSGVAVLEKTGVLLKELNVKNDSVALETGVDYEAVFDEEGYVRVALIPGGKGDGATTLTFSGKVLDPEKVTPEDIVGQMDPTTATASGLECVRQVYPMLEKVPGILLAPRYSAYPVVSAALQAKCYDIGGVFNTVCVVDVDSSESGAKGVQSVAEQKEKQGLTDNRCYPVWLYGKTENGAIYSGSALAAAVTAREDTKHNDKPTTSPSNKAVAIAAACLADGTEMPLDQEQANGVNALGVATFLRSKGWRVWGNNTAAYPEVTAPKYRWFSARRFMLWCSNRFKLAHAERIDQNITKRLIEAIVDEENIYGNALVAEDACAKYQMEYREEDNSAEDLANGHVRFRLCVTPYSPCEVLEEIMEYDAEALTAALS